MAKPIPTLMFLFVATLFHLLPLVKIIDVIFAFTSINIIINFYETLSHGLRDFISLESYQRKDRVIAPLYF